MWSIPVNVIMSQKSSSNMVFPECYYELSNMLQTYHDQHPDKIITWKMGVPKCSVEESKEEEKMLYERFNGLSEFGV
jgi:hypothetical protein